MSSIGILTCPNTDAIAKLRISSITFKVLTIPLSFVNSSQLTVKTRHWLCIFQTVKNIFFILLASSIHSTRFILKTFLGKVKNLLFKIGSEYKIYQLKAVVFTHYIFLDFFFRCCGYTYGEFLGIYGDNPRLNDFLVENTLSYLYNINFSALKVKCF